MRKSKRIKPVRYTQQAASGGSNPNTQHHCKAPATPKYGNNWGARRLFGFHKPGNAKPGPVLVITYK